MALLTTIMTSPDFAEVLFLIGLIVGAVSLIIYAMAHEVAPALLAGAVALISFGLLAV